MVSKKKKRASKTKVMVKGPNQATFSKIMDPPQTKFGLRNLLQAIIGKKRIHPVKLGDLTDLPQGREKLSAAMQQVERTERALKLFWRERNDNESDWAERFKRLDMQSGQVRGAALVILENLLIYP